MYVADPAAVLRICAGHLRPGGVVAFQEYHRAGRGDALQYGSNKATSMATQHPVRGTGIPRLRPQAHTIIAPPAWRPQGPTLPHATTLATTIRRWGREARV
jgi:hypothetical protein